MPEGPAKHSREQAEYLVRELFRTRHGDVPYEPHRAMVGYRMATAIKALAELPFSAEDRDRYLKQYMNDWDDPTYGGLVRYLAVIIARHRG